MSEVASRGVFFEDCASILCLSMAFQHESIRAFPFSEHRGTSSCFFDAPLPYLSLSRIVRTRTHPRCEEGIRCQSARSRCSFFVLPVTSESRVEGGAEMQYGLWRSLSRRKRIEKTYSYDRSFVSGSVCRRLRVEIVSFQWHLSDIQT